MTVHTAFEEAGKFLERTSAACGFRWNSEVRKRLENEIQQAKLLREMLAKRKTGNRSKVGGTSYSDAESLANISRVREDHDDTADYLDQIADLAHKQKLQVANMAKQIKSLHEQLNEKGEIIWQLQTELDKAKAQPSEFTITGDYQALLQILQRARAIGALEESDGQKPTFRLIAMGI